MTVETRKSYCRICTAYCALEVDLDAGRVQKVRGDVTDPVSGGYTCIKGRQLPYQMYGPQRLWQSQRRQPDGSFAPMATAQALDEIADRLRDIVARHGPRAVATYSGNAAFNNSVTLPVVRAWHRGIGSPSNYSTLSIDQPAKIIAAVRHGVWGGGGHTFAEADVALSIGNNPIVSSLTLPGGPPGTNPVKSVSDAKRRGMKLICIDPRRTELARRADLHLQIHPGEDATLLAGMLRAILSEELHDAAFCAEHTDGIEVLSVAVQDFTPDYVARRTRVPAAQMLAAARLFAAGPRGYASSGTGPDMGPHPCLVQHLISSLNTLCGRHNRVGERIPNPGVLSAPLPRPAQAIPRELLPPILSYGSGPASRFRGLRQMFEEMPTTTLADEILEPGDGQVRALITVAGNPAVAVPDQRNMVRALDALELSVCIDVTMTESARRADYVIAARHSFERDDVTEFMDMFYEVPYAHYAEALVVPEGDTIDEWELFAHLARRMGTIIKLPGGSLDVDQLPTKLEVMRLIRPLTRIAFERMRDVDGGCIYDELDVRVDPPLAGMEARLHFAPEGIGEELAAVRAEAYDAGADPFTHRLICRRLGHVLNSVGHEFPQSRAKGRTNPAYMHADDLAALGLASGELVEIVSDQDSVIGVAEATDEIRPGVISMAHCWGSAPDTKVDVREAGSPTSRLVPTDRDYDPITGMARMTAIPVRVRRVAAPPRSTEDTNMRSPDEFNFLDPKTVDDPYPFYAALREYAPVYQVPGTDIYLVSKRHLIEEALERQDDFSANLTGVLMSGPGGEPQVFDLLNLGSAVDAIANADEPSHSVHRKLILPYVTPKVIAALEETLREWAVELIDPLVDMGGGDFVDRVANPLPTRAMALVVGLPLEDVDRLLDWAMTGTEVLAGTTTPERMALVFAKSGEMAAYLGEHLQRVMAASKGQPSAGVIGELAWGVEDGLISESDGVSILLVLVGAGGESTSSLTGSAVRILAEQPELQQELRETPALISEFVEEVLRLESSFRGHYRHVKRDTKLGDVELPEGSRILLLWAAANRDPELFDDPDSVNIRRPGLREHLTFGRGMHFCVGARLARLEARVILEELLARTRSFSLDPRHPPKYVSSIFVRRHAELGLIAEA